jgi:hypothetical protein
MRDPVLCFVVELNREGHERLGKQDRQRDPGSHYDNCAMAGSRWAKPLLLAVPAL